MKLLAALVVAALVMFAGTGPALANHLLVPDYKVGVRSEKPLSCKINSLQPPLVTVLYDTDPDDYAAPFYQLLLYRGKIIALYDSAMKQVYVDVDQDGEFDRLLQVAYPPASLGWCGLFKAIRAGEVKKVDHARHRH